MSPFHQNGTTVLVSYAYDALNRRIVENPGAAVDLFFSQDWQVIEERVSDTPKIQYVWSAVYVDAMVERDRDADNNSSNGLEERLYVQQDANWDVTALVSASGSVQERYIENPYGQVTVLAPDWSIRSSSSFAWIYLHQGGRYDSTSGLYNFRNRDYSPPLGRWSEVDPLGFRAGDVDVYRYLANAPTRRTDPTGLAFTFTVTTGNWSGWAGAAGTWGQPWWDAFGSYSIGDNYARSMVLINGTSSSGGVCNTVNTDLDTTAHSGTIKAYYVLTGRQCRVKVHADIFADISATPGGSCGGNASVIDNFHGNQQLLMCTRSSGPGWASVDFIITRSDYPWQPWPMRLLLLTYIPTLAGQSTGNSVARGSITLTEQLLAF